MKEIEKSEVAVSKIVTRLLSSGLKGYDLSIHALGDEGDIDDEYFESIVRWLVDERIIRYQEITVDSSDRAQCYFLGTVLTAQGFALLNQKNIIAGESQSVAETAKKISEGSLEASKWGELCGGFAGGLFKTLGSG